MEVQPGFERAGLSDIGCQRQNNEDALAYWEPSGEEEFARKGRLLLVADGMGGYEGGQEASRIAIETVQQTYQHCKEQPWQCLLAGFLSAHEQIQSYARVHPELQGMGTTCTTAAVIGLQLYFAHIGDSRLYLVRHGNISRISRDDSYVGRLLESGLISPEEALTHPQRHILTAALGSGTEITPECPETPIDLENDDVLVLCTDGMWGQVEDREIADAASRSPADGCRELVKLARDRGGPDNITVQIARIVPA